MMRGGKRRISVDIWDNPTVLDELERMRAVKRKSGRLTFDCLNTVVKGDRVLCSKSKLLGRSRDGSLSLLMVLRGITSGTCKGCWDYSSGEG